MSKPRIVERPKGRALVNGCCPNPHGYVQGGKLCMMSPHERGGHPIEFTPEDLREMADEIEAASIRSFKVKAGGRAFPRRGDHLPPANA